MLLKYCAIAVILFLAFYISYLIKKKYSERVQLLEELCLLTEYIGNQIEYYCTPTEEILRSYHSIYLENKGFLPLKADENWRDKLKECDLADNIDNTVMEQIYSFSVKLGRSCSDDQLSNCRFTVGLLTAKLEKDRSDIPKRAKAYSALCVVSAFMAVILII